MWAPVGGCVRKGTCAAKQGSVCSTWTHHVREAPDEERGKEAGALLPLSVCKEDADDNDRAEVVVGGKHDDEEEEVVPTLFGEQAHHVPVVYALDRRPN